MSCWCRSSPARAEPNPSRKPPSPLRRQPLTIHDIENAWFAEVYLVEVDNGVTTSVTQGGLPVDEWVTPILPIEGLFDLIEAHVGSGDVVEILYHDVGGYPVPFTIGGSDDGIVLVASIANLMSTG